MPKFPELIPPPAPEPPEKSSEISAKAKKMKLEEMRRRGRRATILTGLLTEPPDTKQGGIVEYGKTKLGA
jgi:hypothetical protein